MIEWCRAKKSFFKGCSFAHSQFKSCYFHQARFEDCNFSGCSFVESNFRGATFINCDFKYSTFKSTSIDARAVIKNRHAWPNASREVIRSLRKNAESLGDVDDVRMCLFAEMEASEEHWRNIKVRNQQYYSNKYSRLQSVVESRYRLLGLWLGRYLWGYGESPLRLLIATIALIITNALARSLLIIDHPPISQSFIRTVDILLGINGFSPAFPLWWEALIVLSRYVTLGLFASVFMRRFSRR
ncbi:pentapeptide repeat-containing protein [Xanthomonas arboricola]